MPLSISAYIFWIGAFTVFYAYLGYGILLFIILKIKKLIQPAPKSSEGEYLPEISFVVCAWNEADFMSEKIANSVAVDYPKSKIKFFFVTDGSDDGTPEIVRNYPFPPGTNWELLHQPERRGKIAAFHRAMTLVDTPIVVSTDANTMVNPECVRRIAAHFADPQTGAVAGEKRISMKAKAAAADAEGIYWKYESLLKKWDAELWSVVGAAGELFAFRTELYRPVPPDTLVEDFYLTMTIAAQGYRTAYEPGAFAVENASASAAEELKRKIRIAAGGIQATVRLAKLLNIFKYRVLSFQFISHRVLRWIPAPLLLPVLLVLNIQLYREEGGIYGLTLLFQTLFYGFALAGALFEQRKIRIKAFFVPYYFCLMNYAMYAGFVRYIRGKQSVIWEKAKRG